MSLFFVLLIALPVCAHAQEKSKPQVQEWLRGEDYERADGLSVSQSVEMEEEEERDLGRAMSLYPKFPEEAVGASGWTYETHGYVRMPLRFQITNQALDLSSAKGGGERLSSRPPYLVDDNYYLSGFAYTRVAEKEWGEVFLQARKRKSRVVVGLFSSQFSDWSETTIQGQGGIATAFAEHKWGGDTGLNMTLRAGMFWDRYGYIEPYDTYLMGRTHISGLSFRLRWERDGLSPYFHGGFGAHADVINANQGFTPVMWGATGVDGTLGRARIDLRLFGLSTWTGDTREFSIVENGVMTVEGGELRWSHPAFGYVQNTLSHIAAHRIFFLSNGVEILHSSGGAGLTSNFLGTDSEYGTGEILANAQDIRWRPGGSLAALGMDSMANALAGLEQRFFSMWAWVLSRQDSDNPLEDRHNRDYLKWGTETFYRPTADGWDNLFVSLRYDRVIMDLNQESMSFRSLSPKFGVTPTTGFDIFILYSYYSYGSNVDLRKNQIPKDSTITKPDFDMFKIQAQVTW